MKAYEIQQFGLDDLKLVDRPEPVAGPGQVVVAMKAWSLNFRDLLVAGGRYNPKLKFPMVPLSDGAGEVLAVGEGVTRVKAGDRVAGIFMQTWIDGPFEDRYAKSAMGGAIDGVLAEQVVLDAEGVTPIPNHLSCEEAATLPCAGVTAWNSVIDTAHLKSSDTVLVLGSGGVSVFALQFAKLKGARVIATSSSEQKAARLKELGASDVINYREVTDWEKKVRELTEGKGVDHVVEVGGAGTFQKSLQATKGGGRVSVIGNLGGLTTDVNVAFILHKWLTIQGIFVGSRAAFESMNAAITDTKFKPVIDKVFGFSDVTGAMRYMESAAHFGKVVISAS
jgi:NADPH:quinone reductase-like Zn-dependent oxidoreductase